MNEVRDRLIVAERDGFRFGVEGDKLTIDGDSIPDDLIRWARTNKQQIIAELTASEVIRYRVRTESAELEMSVPAARADAFEDEAAVRGLRVDRAFEIPANDDGHPLRWTVARQETVKRWLFFVGETSKQIIDEVMYHCAENPEVRAYFTARAEAELPIPVTVTCESCKQAREPLNPALVTCGAGVQYPGAAGWWATDRHVCDRWEAKP